MVPAEHVEGLYGCLDYYQAVDDPFSQKLLAQYDALLPRRRQVHRRQRLLRACTAAIRLWAAAVTEAGSLDQADVIAALDHAEIADGPGRPGGRWCPASTTCA